MKKVKKWGASLLTACLMIVMTAGCGGNAAPSGTSNQPAAAGGDSKPSYNFKLAHITPPTHTWHLAAEKFKEELDKRSGGRMKLEIYPSSQLGTEADMVQQIGAGSVDFGLITAAYLSSRSPSFSAWFTPYAFPDLKAANEARHTDVAKKILATLEQQGLVGLDYLFAGQRVMLFKDKEVLKPEDMAGLKLRVTPSPPLQDFYKFAGASTEGLPLPEVYSAVQTGVIDGMDMDLDATITNKYYEVVKYGAVTNHMVWPAVAMVSKGTFDKMPDEDKQIVRDAIAAAADFSATTRAGQEEEFKKTLSDKGMKIYEIDPALFGPIMKEFDQKYGPTNPLIQEFIDTFRK
ncbi:MULTISPECIES: TRAP transporter substrate-binding protein [Brevibacillus]|jgi:tripartite ATP-independent transporter DctP family solute receptor|uniref:Putative C4-dicarboxylate-binding periplasmic protein n=1 Tax=Brevibacillus borstelensis AK1 TaxID=1300222 RepID=M8DXL8_9BACL|nr:TRAP transporter substrate-binding protein [Brevibacillus borstelensis]EMT51751.1 putative C4-dicarboxylate-binding periplasmic protein [Brevibacillus borstelensis AK1]KKX56162.1 C4-dicarboxylate ABC transporter substrate-binding protein [Brevibacillus borstelensis cifa_chp40]MBE5397213.1 TRAP transporter substrate-binding protein [Brevibacillus borstelensis]MCC0564020.1 TRAP transporter substrate-binding protein [Brevibacillus borstelensis]MCM3470248.1 TRAP transporter substrate-binding pr